MQTEAEQLQRRLGLIDVYALAVGSVVGTGIFFLPGKAAAALFMGMAAEQREQQAVVDKTSIRDSDDDEQTKADIAHAFQTAVIDTLIIKCKRALKQTGIKRLVIAGGVSANVQLRAQLERVMQGMKGRVYYPRTEFCTDNGAMIAYAGMQRLKAGQFATLDGDVERVGAVRRRDRGIRAACQKVSHDFHVAALCCNVLQRAAP